MSAPLSHCSYCVDVPVLFNSGIERVSCDDLETTLGKSIHIKSSRRLFPSRMGVFTRTSEEPLTTPWRVEPIEELSELPTSRTRNWFGLRRDGRAQGVEIGSLQDQIEEDDWNECTFMDSPAECVSKISQDYTRVSVTNLTRNPTLCDSVVLLEREPVPLLYRDKLDQYTRALRWVGLDIDCES